MKWFKDLLYGPGNAYFDLGRLLALLSALAMFGGAGWNVWLGLPLDLGPAGFGGGLAAVIGALAALIFAKDKMSAPQGFVSSPPAPPKCPPKRRVRKP